MASNKKNQELHSAHFVIESRDWYRNQYKSMSGAVFICLCLLAISLLFNVVQYMAEPDTKFFATSTDMQIVELSPLEDPLISEAGLTNWVAQVVSDTFFYSFVDWRDNLLNMRKYYSDKGFASLIKAMKSSGNLDMVRNNRLISKAGVNPAEVVIVNQGILSGKMTWRVEVPLKRTYESSDGIENRQNLDGLVVVQRVPVTESDKGVKIIQMVFQ